MAVEKETKGEWNGANESNDGDGSGGLLIIKENSLSFQKMLNNGSQLYRKKDFFKYK